MADGEEKSIALPLKAYRHYRDLVVFSFSVFLFVHLLLDGRNQLGIVPVPGLALGDRTDMALTLWLWEKDMKTKRNSQEDGVKRWKNFLFLPLVRSNPLIIIRKTNTRQLWKVGRRRQTSWRPRELRNSRGASPLESLCVSETPDWGLEKPGAWKRQQVQTTNRSNKSPFSPGEGWEGQKTFRHEMVYSTWTPQGELWSPSTPGLSKWEA